MSTSKPMTNAKAEYVGSDRMGRVIATARVNCEHCGDELVVRVPCTCSTCNPRRKYSGGTKEQRKLWNRRYRQKQRDKKTTKEEPETTGLYTVS